MGIDNIIFVSKAGEGACLITKIEWSITIDIILSQFLYMLYISQNYLIHKIIIIKHSSAVVLPEFCWRNGGRNILASSGREVCCVWLSADFAQGYLSWDVCWWSSSNFSNLNCLPLCRLYLQSSLGGGCWTYLSSFLHSFSLFLNWTELSTLSWFPSCCCLLQIHQNCRGSSCQPFLWYLNFSPRFPLAIIHQANHTKPGWGEP